MILEHLSTTSMDREILLAVISVTQSNHFKTYLQQVDHWRKEKKRREWIALVRPSRSPEQNLIHLDFKDF